MYKCRKLLQHGPGPKMDFIHISGQKEAIWNTFANINWFGHGVLDKKLSYCWETVRRESMPRIAACQG